MLKRTALAVVAGSVLAGAVSAKNQDELREDNLIGIEAGYASIKGDTMYDYEHSGNGAEYGVRIGAQTEEWRTMFMFDYYNDSAEDQELATFLVSADYYLVNEGALRAFIGANVGYANYESTYIDDSTFVFGGQIGLVLGIANHIDVDLSYRYSYAASDHFDHIGRVVFGVNYLFH